MIEYKVQVYEDQTIWKNQDGKYHRLDGPAVEYSDGSKLWYVNGKQHRLDGPALVYSSGSKSWWVDGKLHRLDGPAREWANGDREWWVDDEQYSEEDFNEKIKEMRSS